MAVELQKILGDVANVMRSRPLNLMSLMSPGSRDLVERHPDFAANDLAADPNVLRRFIRETHSTNTTGTGKEQVLSNKVLMQMEFNDLRQGKSSIIDFK